MNIWLRRCLARAEAATSGYLAQVGWMETRATRQARDSSGKAILWFTYPAIRLLADRVQRDWRVLEFGAGAGTLWWHERTREVTAVEHEPQWAAEIAAQCTATVLSASGDDAAGYADKPRGTGPYDVVIVDGLFRNECLALAPSLLSERGIVILDDAQRPEYAPAIRELHARGFRSIELHGPQPVSKHPGCTTIFYRTGNALGI